MPKPTPNTTKNLLVLTPVLGIIVFSILYVVSTFLYPGGSNADQTTTGFDWINNYWCDLTGQFAKNGETNTARPIALTAMLCLCSTLAAFWYYVPRLFKENKFNQVIRYAGMTSMAVAVFLFTGYHDTVIHVAGLLGFAAMTGVFIGLYNNNLTKLFSFGVFCLGLMLFNYFIYETNFLISTLPLIQKATFVLFLLWICLIDLYLYQKSNEETPN